MPRRRKTSSILTDQVAGDALGEMFRSGERGALPEARPSLRNVQVDNIVSESDLQTRAPFDPETDSEDAELVESVREVGVRQPVHLLDRGDGTYRIRSGHRRVSAARLAGRSEVPAIVWPVGTDALDSALDTLLENLHRKDLAPLERGRMLSRILERFELPRSPDTARKLGLSKTSFYRYLSLLKAPTDVQEALRDGGIGVMQAEKLATIESPEIRVRLIEAAAAGAAPDRMEELLRRHQAGEPVVDQLEKGNVGSGSEESKPSGQEDEQSWASRKTHELSNALAVSPENLKPITKGLNARRISAAHATAAALLVAAGEGTPSALEVAGTLSRKTLGAVETLYKEVVADPASPRYRGGWPALRQILAYLAKRIDKQEVGDE